MSQARRALHRKHDPRHRKMKRPCRWCGDNPGNGTFQRVSARRRRQSEHHRTSTRLNSASSLHSWISCKLHLRSAAIAPAPNPVTPPAFDGSANFNRVGGRKEGAAQERRHGGRRSQSRFGNRFGPPCPAAAATVRPARRPLRRGHAGCGDRATRGLDNMPVTSNRSMQDRMVAPVLLMLALVLIRDGG
jgi:hypothetical protein